MLKNWRTYLAPDSRSSWNLRSILSIVCTKMIFEIQKSVPYLYFFHTTSFDSLGLNSLALFPLDSDEGHVTTPLSGLPNDERNVLSMLYSKLEIISKKGNKFCKHLYLLCHSQRLNRLFSLGFIRDDNQRFIHPTVKFLIRTHFALVWFLYE